MQSLAGAKYGNGIIQLEKLGPPSYACMTFTAFKIKFKMIKKSNNCITTTMHVVVNVFPIPGRPSPGGLFLYLFWFTSVVILENCPEVDKDRLFHL